MFKGIYNFFSSMFTSSHRMDYLESKINSLEKDIESNRVATRCNDIKISKIEGNLFTLHTILDRKI